MTSGLTPMIQLGLSYNYRLFHIPPDKPQRAYVFRHDVLENVPFDEEIVVEISLADGSIIKQIPRPPWRTENEKFRYENKSDHNVGHMRSDFSITIEKKYDGQLVLDRMFNPNYNRKFILPPEVVDYIDPEPLPRMMLGDKFWLISLFDGEENRGDGSKIFLIDTKNRTAQVVSCLPDSESGTFPGKRRSYTYTKVDNRFYVMVGVSRMGPVPLDIWELILPTDGGQDSFPIWRLLSVKSPCITSFYSLAVSSDGCIYAMFANTFLDSARSTTPASFRRLCKSSHSSLVCLGSIGFRSLKQITSLAFLRYFPRLIGKTEEELREAGLPNYVMELLQ